MRVSLIGQKALYSVHVEFACKTRSSMRRLNRKRCDALSMSNYVIKKWCRHGAGHGKSEEQTSYHQAVNAWKRCRKKMPHVKITQEYWTDFEGSAVQVNHKRNTDGTKKSVTRWTN